MRSRVLRGYSLRYPKPPRKVLNPPDPTRYAKNVPYPYPFTRWKYVANDTCHLCMYFKFGTYLKVDQFFINFIKEVLFELDRHHKYIRTQVG